MSWWNIIKQDWELHAFQFQLQLSFDNLTAYRITLNQEEENYFKEIFGKTPAMHHLFIAPNSASIRVNEIPEKINDLEEALMSMGGMGRLSNKEKLDLLRLRPNTYCLIEHDGGFSNPSQLKYVMGNELIFRRTVIAMENSVQQVKDNKRDVGFIP